MQIFSQLTDDQIALVGCAVALFVAGTLMSLSFYLGKSSRSDSNRSGQAFDKRSRQAAEERQRRAA